MGDTAGIVDEDEMQMTVMGTVADSPIWVSR